jgi:hypothetical protein
MYQHFSGHTVNPLYAAISNLWTTYSHWPSESLAVVKDLNIFKYRLSNSSSVFKVWKKFFKTLLSQRLPLRLMPCRANNGMSAYNIVVI